MAIYVLMQGHFFTDPSPISLVSSAFVIIVNDTGEKNRWIMNGATIVLSLVQWGDTGVQFQFVADVNASAIIFVTYIFIKLLIIRKVHPPPLLQASLS
jgi:hypothetical protein